MKTALLPLLVFALFFLCIPTGCTRTHFQKSPDTTAKAGAVSITQTGDALSPAVATSKGQSATFTFPKGATFVFNDKLGTVEATVTGGGSVLWTKTDDTATAAAAFTPPAPPSPKDLAAGRVALWLWIGLVGGIALVGLGIGWGGKLVTLGGACVAGACAFGIFVQDNAWVLTVAGIGVTLAGGGFAAWHLWLKHKQPGAQIPLPLPTA